MGGGGSPDGAQIKFKVLAVDLKANTVVIEVEGNKAQYFEVGKSYEAAVRTKQP